MNILYILLGRQCRNEVCSEGCSLIRCLPMIRRGFAWLYALYTGFALRYPLSAGCRGASSDLCKRVGRCYFRMLWVTLCAGCGQAVYNGCSCRYAQPVHEPCTWLSMAAWQLSNVCIGQITGQGAGPLQVLRAAP